jgi:hypothetical protein
MTTLDFSRQLFLGLAVYHAFGALALYLLTLL